MIFSESQERMSVAIDPKNYKRIMEIIREANLEGLHVADITTDEEEPKNNRLEIEYKGEKIVSISRDFLNTNGAPRSTNARINIPEEIKFFKQGSCEKLVALHELKAHLEKLENA